MQRKRLGERLPSLFLCLSLYLVSFLFVLPIQACEPSAKDIQQAIDAKVLWVYDGDTIKVEYLNIEVGSQSRKSYKQSQSDSKNKRKYKSKKVRLIGIDAPELASKYRKKSQAYANKAKTELKQLLPKGKKVKLVLGKQKYDKYGRVLAYVYTHPPFKNLKAKSQQQWLDVQAHMLNQGLALSIVIAPNSKHLNCYRWFEAKARTQRRNLWQGAVDELRIRDLSTSFKAYARLKGEVSSLKISRHYWRIELDNKLNLWIKTRLVKKLSPSLKKAIKNYKKKKLILKVRGQVSNKENTLKLYLAHPDNLSKF